MSTASDAYRLPKTTNTGWVPPTDAWIHVSRAEMGDDWPLTVDAGILHCFPYRPDPTSEKTHWAAAFTTGGKTYALNQTAMDLSRAENRGWTMITDAPIVEKGDRPRHSPHKSTTALANRAFALLK